MIKRVRWWTFGGGCAERYTHDGKRVAFVNPEPGKPEWCADTTEAGGVYASDLEPDIITAAMATADEVLLRLGYELDGPGVVVAKVDGSTAAQAMTILEGDRLTRFRKRFPAEAKEYEEAEHDVRELQAAMVRMFACRGEEAFIAAGYVRENLHVIERWQLALCAYETFCMRDVQPINVVREENR